MSSKQRLRRNNDYFVTIMALYFGVENTADLGYKISRAVNQAIVW